MIGANLMQNAFNSAMQGITNFQAQQKADALQQQIFQREDSQIQRRIQDAKLAGVSPLVALGAGGMGATTVVQPAQFTPAQMGGLAEAMQMEVANLQGADKSAIEWEKLGLDRKRFEEDTRQFDESLANAKNQADIERAVKLRMQKLDHEFQMEVEKIHDKAIRDQMTQSYNVEMTKIRTMISENAKSREHGTDGKGMYRYCKRGF